MYAGNLNQIITKLSDIDITIENKKAYIHVNERSDPPWRAEKIQCRAAGALHNGGVQQACQQHQ